MSDAARAIVGRALMRLPGCVWSRLPGRLRSWAVDVWLWEAIASRDLYGSLRDMRRALGSRSS